MRLSELERLEPGDDDTLADVLALENAARVADAPWRPPVSPTMARAFRRYGWDGEPGEEWLLRDGDGRLAGKVDAYLPERENRHVAFGGVLVHPERRGQGQGQGLAAALQERARQASRRVLITSTLDAAGPRAFAERLGFTWATADIYRRQDLREVDWDRIGALRAKARAAASGYTVSPLGNPVPDDLIKETAVMEAAINDAPRDDLASEDGDVTPERIRARERTIAAGGLREYRLVARRERDGRLAGHSVVHIDPEWPDYGHQGDTSVLAEHRGHRLGMLLKAEMVFWLAEAEPEVRWLDTGNTESNHHMIAINEALGYQVMARSIGWQRDL